MKPVIYLEGDVIYKAGTESDCMYFVASGTVALIAFSGREVSVTEIIRERYNGKSSLRLESRSVMRKMNPRRSGNDYCPIFIFSFDLLAYVFYAITFSIVFSFFLQKHILRGILL